MVLRDRVVAACAPARAARCAGRGASARRPVIVLEARRAPHRRRWRRHGGQQEIVVKGSMRRVARCRYFSGATIMGDGVPALISTAGGLVVGGGRAMDDAFVDWKRVAGRAPRDVPLRRSAPIERFPMSRRIVHRPSPSLHEPTGVEIFNAGTPSPMIVAPLNTAACPRGASNPFTTISCCPTMPSTTTPVRARRLEHNHGPARRRRLARHTEAARAGAPAAPRGRAAPIARGPRLVALRRAEFDGLGDVGEPQRVALAATSAIRRGTIASVTGNRSTNVVRGPRRCESRSCRRACGCA